MMPATLVDSNVLLDVLYKDPTWFGWSSTALAECLEMGNLCINPVIYAEISTGYRRVEELDAALSYDSFVRLQIPYEAAFLAGKAYLTYRRKGGSRTSTLPDFLIGAHAATSGLRLLTRDARRYRTYFPSLELIAPGD